MNKEIVKQLSLKAFAFTIFFYGIYYIVNAGPTSEIFNPFPGRIVVVYLTAFVDITIATSIIINRYVVKICYWGGLYWIFMTSITFIAGIVGDPNNFNNFLFSFIFSTGYGAAI